jgi:hypothetical protein
MLPMLAVTVYRVATIFLPRTVGEEGIFAILAKS